jgi:hypothetical protein
MATGNGGVTPITLSVESYNSLLEAERRINGLHSEFDKMTECGIECQYLRDASRDMLERMAKMKQHYKPR